MSIVTLERYEVLGRPRLWSPYRRVNGEWVTTARTIHVRRVPGLPMAISLLPRHGYAARLTRREKDYAVAWMRRRGWIGTVRRRDLTINRYPWLDGDLDCNADLLRRLNLVGRDLRKRVFIRSGRRTMSEQWALWNRYGSPRAAYPNPNAPHVRGVAADCGIDGRDIGDYPGARAAMKRHGLCLRVPGEDWHVEVGNTWNA